MRKTYYEECEYCHGHLDPGEKCDCQEIKMAERKKLEHILRMSETMQYEMILEKVS